ncbi:hypothetical protein VitviT2T_012713 [Vitis vinifera]|nr:hypothetical protein VitviT2T_012713 [Vitis vinifera]
MPHVYTLHTHQTLQTYIPKPPIRVCWCSNFRGQVTVASVDNFQLVFSPEDGSIGQQHEKITSSPEKWGSFYLSWITGIHSPLSSVVGYFLEEHGEFMEVVGFEAAPAPVETETEAKSALLHDKETGKFIQQPGVTELIKFGSHGDEDIPSFTSIRPPRPPLGPLPAGFHSRSRGRGVRCSIRGSRLEGHENEGESAAASTDQIESPHEENAREKRKSSSSKTDAPLLLDLQVEEIKYVFEVKTFQRIGLLVLSTLQWKVISEYISTGRSVDEILNAIKTVLLQKPDAANAFGSFLDEDQIAANLVKNGQMVVGINTVFMQTHIGEVSRPYICSERMAHGVLLVGHGSTGHDPIRMKGRPYWIVKNSWDEKGRASEATKSRNPGHQTHHPESEAKKQGKMPHRTRPMTALLVFTGLNVVLASTITPVYDFVCFLPYWERRRERRRQEREASLGWSVVCNCDYRSSMANIHISNGEAGPSSDSLKPMVLTSSASFKARKKPTISRAGSEVEDVINLLHGSDPVRVELNRLENEVRDKDRELGDAHAEIKALKYSERLKEKAVEELTDELQKVDGKLKATEALLESKNLEIKKINDERKAALAAQFAAEATLRRVHAAQKDDEMPPIEAIIAPLEAELKLARLEAAKLQDDNRALDRLTKSKETALLEAERTVEIALAKASLVDDLQNKNQELMKQIEICQEENKILDKMHRQKVAEVKKLTQTVCELEEAVLAGGAAANAVRDYRRKVQEMNDERKILDRELSRAKVTANRVAVVVANEWKDANDKVMPVKQWLEERKFFQAYPISVVIYADPISVVLQGEMQLLRDKLAVAERTAKAEAQLKEKYQLRFKVLEERLRASPSGNLRTTSEGRSISNGPSRRQSLGGAENLSRSASNGFALRRTANSQSGSIRSNSASVLLRNAKISSRSFDGGSRSLDRDKVIPNAARKHEVLTDTNDQIQNAKTIGTHEASTNGNRSEKTKSELDDSVSGVLYDMLQKEVITLRRACHEKDQSLKDKDDAIEMLAKKVDTLNKAMGVEAKKMRREVAAMEKEVAAMRVSKEHDPRARRPSAPRGSQLLSAR